MNKEVANKLTALISNPKALDGLIAYLEYRIEQRRNSLEVTTDVSFDRGAINELRLLKDIRKTAVAVMEVKDG